MKYWKTFHLQRSKSTFAILLKSTCLLFKGIERAVHIKRMSFHGCPVTYEHSTRFKENHLKLMPELTEYKAGRDIIMSLREESGNAIFDACDLQDD